MKLLDLFCCQGGASMGYHRAGFDVVGVDINPQPHYPFEFHQGDALAFLMEYGDEFDVIAGSPPCQAHTNAQKIMGNQHPDYIDSMRALLPEGKPYVIENVPGAPLRNPIELCGAMFGLGTYRHRLFESNIDLAAPDHPEHSARTTKMGRKPVVGEFMHVVGNFSGVNQAREAMGIDWMTRDGLRESIPPAYTEHIGAQLLANLTEVAA
ncbi:DNA cytosine methyltransferase [Prescottella equi]|uniref:DNA cytosine methyltransferase n=1 Tax=Rhodococcus hoagii TaxID=43767 RepID=UPI0023DBC275|nr:DNA cytosine methyltransferase [Prescottella equi]